MRVVALVLNHSIGLLISSLLLLREDCIVPLFLFITSEVRVGRGGYILNFTRRIVSVSYQRFSFDRYHVSVVIEKFKDVLYN